jgi:diguanylate cyclase (GGDEF)-like protein/PAS domain S-box-containing protein
MSTDITIEQIIQPQILTCAPDTPLSNAARRMAAAHCSSIMVADGNEVIGIWTEQDAVALDAFDAATLRAPISQYMTSPVKTLHYKTLIGEAAMRFREERLRHFLVVDDDGNRLGIITQSDIVINQGIEYYIALREVKSVLKRQHLTIPGEMSLGEAVKRMHAGRFDAIVTTCPAGTLGILTERDVVRLIGDDKPLAPVGELANTPLISTPSTASLYHARKLFTENNIRHLGVTGEDGELLGLVTFSDILESIEYDYVHQLLETLREREHSLSISLQQLRLATKVFEHTFEGIMVTNADNVIESVNPAFTQITGFNAFEVIGKTPSLLSSGRHDADFYRKMREDLNEIGFWRGEIWNRRKNGEVYPEWLSVNTVRNTDGQVTNYIAVFSDITKRKTAEDQMHYLAHHDALTSLPNRTLFVERLSHAIAHAQRNQKMVAVIFLDLDYFKQVNDTLGHHVGDQLLQMVAQRLTDCVRAEDTVARLGGDEFTVILEEIADAENIPAVARKIIDSLSQPMTLDGKEMTITTSLGICLYPNDGGQPDTLIKHADTAMYLAKEKGRNNFQFFTAAMENRNFPQRDM